MKFIESCHHKKASCFNIPMPFVPELILTEWFLLQRPVSIVLSHFLYQISSKTESSVSNLIIMWKQGYFILNAKDA